VLLLTGQKVPVATIGTVLYDTADFFYYYDQKVRYTGQRKPRMICAEDEWVLENHDGIMMLDSLLGTPATALFSNRK
jgi:phenylalanyl-tRNA synthetase beta chain